MKRKCGSSSKAVRRSSWNQTAVIVEAGGASLPAAAGSQAQRYQQQGWEACSGEAKADDFHSLGRAQHISRKQPIARACSYPIQVGRSSRKAQVDNNFLGAVAGLCHYELRTPAMTTTAATRQVFSLHQLS
jgi:hypothetical protein